MCAAVLAAALSILVTHPHLLGAPAREVKNTAGHDEAKRDWAPAFSPALPYAPYYNADCRSPKDREEADLCQQWRVAEATEKAVELADSQYLWNIAQAVGTLLAAVAAVYAAFKAGAAANAAFEANKIGRHDSVASQRAWLSIDAVRIVAPANFKEGGFLFAVNVEGKNHGPSPATSMFVYAESFFLSPGASYSEAEERFISKLKTHPVWMGTELFPNDEFSIGQSWGAERTQFQDALSDRPGGTIAVSLNLFVGVTYRVVGDQDAHMTYRSYSMLNWLVGFELRDDHSIELRRDQFLVGKVD